MSNVTEMSKKRFKENIEFSVLLDVGDSNNAEEACSSLNPPARLSSFASIEEFNFILDLISLSEEFIPFLWIGFDRESLEDLTSISAVVKAFKFSDRTPNLVADRPSEFPWASDEPSNLSQGQFCVGIRFNESSQALLGLDDQFCTRNEPNQGAVCKRFLSNSATRVDPDEEFQITVLTLSGAAETFEDGINGCAELEPPGQLASFTNEADFNVILETLQLIPPLAFAWVGLQRGPDEDGTNAADFEFLDGTPNIFANVNSVFPWDPIDEEPDNFDGDQRCVAVTYILSNPNVLVDLTCDREAIRKIGAVCKQLLVDTPTESPTNIPEGVSGVPTTRPTESPTNNSTQIDIQPIPEAFDEDAINISVGISAITVFVLIVFLVLLLIKKQKEKDKITLLFNEIFLGKV